MRRVRHRAAAAEGALRPLRRRRRGARAAALAGDEQPRRHVRAAPRRALRAEAGSTAAPADRDRRQRTDAHVAHRRAFRAALELDRRHRSLARDQGARSRSAAPRSAAIPRRSTTRSTCASTPAAGPSAIADSRGRVRRGRCRHRHRVSPGPAHRERARADRRRAPAPRELITWPSPPDRRSPRRTPRSTARAVDVRDGGSRRVRHPAAGVEARAGVAAGDPRSEPRPRRRAVHRLRRRDAHVRGALPRRRAPRDDPRSSATASRRATASRS